VRYIVLHSLLRGLSRWFGRCHTVTCCSTYDTRVLAYSSVSTNLTRLRQLGEVSAAFYGYNLSAFNKKQISID